MSGLLLHGHVDKICEGWGIGGVRVGPAFGQLFDPQASYRELVLGVGARNRHLCTSFGSKSWDHATSGGRKNDEMNVAGTTL